MIPALSQNSLPVGILMNRASFPRLPGDIGNPATFPFAVRYRMVPGTTYHDVVEALQEERLLVPFIAAAQALEQEGVCAITTSCGFLAMFQKEVAAAVNIPVFCSSLLQGGFVSDQLPEGKILGILTANSEKLTERHFKGVGIDRVEKVVYGMQGTHFYHIFVDNNTDLNFELAQQEMVDQAKKMVAEHPNVGAIVFECTNMPPYAKAVQEATGLPVYDITTLANYVMESANRKLF